MKKKRVSDELPEFMSKKQIAGYFDVSTKTVERMFIHGLQSIKLRGKRYVTKSQLHDYINRIQSA
jgi:hypothetical protein